MAQKLTEQGKANKLAYIKKYQNATYTTIGVKCRKDSDGDIFEILSKQPSKNDFIKKAIRHYATVVDKE